MADIDLDKDFGYSGIERIPTIDDQKERQDALIKLEIEKKKLEREVLRLQDVVLQLNRENQRLKNELKQFRTPPQLVGTIVDLLHNGRALVKNGTGQTFLVSLSTELSTKTLQEGDQVSMDRNNLTIIDVLPSSKDPIISAAEIIEKPTVTYEDIGGLEEQIVEIKEAVELPLISPHLFEEVGIRPPKGILLIGPPGTGKTLLAKAVANTTEASFIRLVGSELVQKFIGEGGRLVRELFQLAKEKRPAIIFIDEIDAIGARRLSMDTTGDREVQRTLMQLLAEMDGFDPLNNISIIAATNRLDIIDEALLRPGRFDRIIEIDLPDRKGIEAILDIHTRTMSIGKGVDIPKLAKDIEGATGADIAAICMEAGMFAIRDDRTKVKMKDFKKAIDKYLKKEKMCEDDRMFH